MNITSHGSSAEGGEVVPVMHDRGCCGRPYPDFILAVQSEGESKRITVLETKGDQLDNLDTAYKREVLEFLSGTFQWDDYTPAGELELVKNTGETVQGTLILISEWKSKMPIISPDGTPHAAHHAARLSFSISFS